MSLNGITPLSWLRRLSRIQLLGVMTGLFLLSRVLARLAGIRFDAAPLVHFWQYLDPELLRTRLLESVYYLHAQPPLFNLFLGGVLQCFPGREGTAFYVLFLGCGLLLYLALFRLLRVLGLARPPALLLSTLFILSPSALCYENWLFYTYPLALLLVVSALALHHTLKGGGFWSALLFFSLLVVLAGVRSLFHPLCLVLLAGGLALAARGRRRTILVAAVIPFLFLAALLAKNLVLFHRFTASSWLGMNTWGMVCRNIPRAELERMAAANVVSPLALIDRFSPLDRYPEPYLAIRGFPDVPALRQVQKSTGYGNYNHAAYLAISDQYGRDTVEVLRRRPGYFLLGAAKSWFHYFQSSSDYIFLDENVKKIRWWNGLYDYLLYGKIPFPLSSADDPSGMPRVKKPKFIYIFLLAGLPAVFLCGLWRSRRPAPGWMDSNQRVLVLYLCFMIAWVAFFGNLLESGENNRFRFMTDPFSIALFGLCLRGLAGSAGAKPLHPGVIGCGSRPDSPVDGPV